MNKKINRETLDSMLCLWARFYLSEFNETNWAKVSMSGKIMEFAELGIMSKGTKHIDNSYTIPEHIERTVLAITRLESKYRQVIKEEYTGVGVQHRKARRLNLNISRYRNRLMRARVKLMLII